MFGATAAVLVWNLVVSEAAVAQTRVVDIPAGPLFTALTELSRQTGASVGTSTRLPAVSVRAVRGKLTADEALARMLRSIGWRAIRLGPLLFRLEPVPTLPRPVLLRRQHDVAPVLAPTEDVVVTATKRGERRSAIAAPIAVVREDEIAMIGNGADTAAIARTITGLTVTNLGIGRDRLFVRGTADSPFDGFGQASTAVQIGEARATYDAPDPDLQLIDVAQVELLKGPQGPLYGTGALGGVFRIVPASPELRKASGEIQIGGSVTQGGSPDAQATAILNLPLRKDAIGIRAVGYWIGQGGWIGEQGKGGSINHGSVRGGRVGLRADAGGWTVDAVGWTQMSSLANSQYVESAGTIDRAALLAEPQDTEFTLASVSASGPIAGLSATVVASGTWQELRATYDASARATILGSLAPVAYIDARQYQVSTLEARLGRTYPGFEWLAGLSLLDARTDATGTLSSAPDQPILHYLRQASEIAAFADVTAGLTARLKATAGVRVFRSAIDDDRRREDNAVVQSRASIRASPSLGLSWTSDGGLLLFARYASALRPGGVEPGLRTGDPSIEVQSDELQSFDLGGRLTSRDGRLSVDAGVFQSIWAHVQADFLTADGLVMTRNAGDAQSHGLDLSFTWRPSAAWSLSSGLLAQRPRLESSTTGVFAVDRRLPVVPDVAAHAQAAYTFGSGAWLVTPTLGGTYSGSRRLSFDPRLDRRIGPSASVYAALTATRNGWESRLAVENLTDSRADSFAFGNPFAVADRAQHTPLRPRTLSMSLRRAF